jgi:GT2 family glycosyltransferase
VSDRTDDGLACTVVVVSWNRADLLRRCLPALLAQELPGRRFEVVVVDNGSSDDTAAVLASEFPAVRVIHSRTNRGFAGGNNLALRTVTAPYAVLLNNDAVPEPGWLAALLAPFAAPGGERLGASGSKILFLDQWQAFRIRTRAFEAAHDDPRALGLRLVSARVDGQELLDEVCGAVHGPEPGFRWTKPQGRLHVPRRGPGPWHVELDFTTGGGRDPEPLRIDWTDGSTQVLVADPEVTTVTIDVPATSPPARLINNTGGVLFRDGSGADRDWLRPDDGSYDEPADLFFGCGNGLAVRTEAGREVGWFDDAYFLYYEDVDLSWRLRSRGWQVRYTPEAVILHERGASSAMVPARTAMLIERNRLLTLLINASSGFAVRELRRFARTTVRMAVTRDTTGPQRRLQLRAAGSLLRLLPHALRARRSVRRSATVAPAELEQLLTTRRAWERRGH